MRHICLSFFGTWAKYFNPNAKGLSVQEAPAWLVTMLHGIILASENTQQLPLL